MNYKKILKEIEQEIQEELAHGKVADYIPALAEVEPNQFGFAVVYHEDRFEYFLIRV